MEKFLTKKEVAALLQVSTKTVERKVKEGAIPRPSYRLGVRLPRWRSGDFASHQPPRDHTADLNASK